MKTLLILLLSLALAGAAFITKPSKKSFEAYLEDHGLKDTRSTLEKVVLPSPAQMKMGQYEFKDRVLWVDVRKDGETIYTGAFSHWFARAAD